MIVSAIIVAGGRGERMGSSVPKQFLDVKGVPLISFCLSFFEKSEVVDEVIIVTLPEWVDNVEKRIVSKANLRKVRKVIVGGEFRQDSFRLGLEKADGEIVVDHDAVRPFPGFLDVEDMVEKCMDFGAVIPVVPVSDTVKYLDGNKVRVTVDRGDLFCVQTPQVFKRDLCKRAYDLSHDKGFRASDTAALFEKAGIDVYTVRGSVFNIKVTTKEDILLLEKIDQIIESGRFSKFGM